MPTLLTTLSTSDHDFTHAKAYINTSSSPENPSHQFTPINVSGLSLHRVSPEFADAIESSSHKLTECIKNHLSVVGVKFSLRRVIWSELFIFIPPCHRDIIKNHIIRKLVNMFLGKALKNEKNSISQQSSIKSIQRKSRPT